MELILFSEQVPVERIVYRDVPVPVHSGEERIVVKEVQVPVEVVREVKTHRALAEP